jgi:hypothetical protein
MREFAMRLPVLAGAMLTWAAPTAASPVDDAFATCRPFVTVQYEGCEVETFARCPDGGTFRRENSSDGIPAFARSTPDRDVVFDLDAEGYGILRVLEARDSQSMGELLENGFGLVRHGGRVPPALPFSATVALPRLDSLGWRGGGD